MNTIDARDYVGTGFPPDEGKKLAEALLSMSDFSWEEDVIDARRCSPSLLISSFFNSFLQTIYEDNEDFKQLDVARNLNWKFEHPFQYENAGNWMQDFKPQAVA